MPLAGHEKTGPAHGLFEPEIPFLTTTVGSSDVTDKGQYPALGLQQTSWIILFSPLFVRTHEGKL